MLGDGSLRHLLYRCFIVSYTVSVDNLVFIYIDLSYLSILLYLLSL